MHLLDQQELIKIKERVSSAEVTNASLSIDLVDHICCMIEERIELGMNLQKAENAVFKELGEVQLKSIDIETKFLTQNKFIMKKRTKIIGIIAALLMAAGFTMKLLHLMGAAMVWGVGVLLVAFGFALMLTIDKFSYEKSSSLKTNSIIGYLGSASFILGSGFKLLHLPGSHYLIAIGGVLLFIFFIFSNVLASNNIKAN